MPVVDSREAGARARWSHLPIRIPGAPARETRPVGTLLPATDFIDGWMKLSNIFNMPASDAARDAHYSALRYRLTIDQFKRAVDWAITNLTVRPRPSQLIAAGDPEGAKPRLDANPFAGCWIFLCEGSWHTCVTDKPLLEAPRFCHRPQCQPDPHEYKPGPDPWWPEPEPSKEVRRAEDVI